MLAPTSNIVSPHVFLLFFSPSLLLLFFLSPRVYTFIFDRKADSIREPRVLKIIVEIREDISI